MKYKIIKKYKVIVGLSGGVDSSVTIWILKILGYEVECVFIKSWENDDNEKNCNSKIDFNDSKNICKHLDVKLIKINFSYEYWNKVFKIFIKEQKKGKTPNPDILCNKKIKFNLFLNFSIKILKANFISTGHYVIKHLNKKNKFLLLKGKDKKKDQSYFLYTLNQKQLKKCLFPLGYFKKKKIRKIAKNINLINYKKKDSTGICFIGKKKFKTFINKYIPNNCGYILDIKNNIIGKHNGLFYYTIGQRKNLNIKIKNTKKKPFFVFKKNIHKNVIWVVEGKKNKFLFSYGIKIKKIHLIHLKNIKKKLFCKLKVRYQQKEKNCIIYPKKNKYFNIYFKKPIFAVTPGQSAVFYKKNICLGGGIIEKTISNF